MQEVNFLQGLHKATKRDYLERANLPDRAECMRIASQYGKDYWDGDRKYGYGGYNYDGRWKSIAELLIKHYSFRPSDRILDFGCGKGHLLYEIGCFYGIQKYLPVKGFMLDGIDISPYALNEANILLMDGLSPFSLKTEISQYQINYFDFVYSVNVLHNFNYADLKSVIKKIVRVMKGKAWIVVESFRNEEQKCNLLNWALTCQSYYSPDDWKNILSDNGYKGDVEFMVFE